MQRPEITRSDLIGWVGSGAALLSILYLKLLPALIAALLVFALVNRLTPLLSVRFLRGRGPRVLAVSLIAALVIALIVGAGTSLASSLRQANDSLPALVARVAEIIDHSRQRLPGWVIEYLPADADQLRKMVVEALREHAQMFQVAGTGLGRAVAQILIGMVIGGLLSMHAAAPVPSPAPLTAAIAAHARRLAEAFSRVVFAQFWISAINTTLTGLFLVVVLPHFQVNLPFVQTLVVLTFLLGLIPILGNVMSNSVIFLVSLSQSLTIAVVVLLYLIGIHKLEYFLNARIVGAHISARAWELLTTMLLMEAAFGIPGLIAAPIYYAWLKSELRVKGLV